MKVEIGVKVTVTATQLSEIYGVTRQTVYNWVKLGMPSNKQPGMARRFDVNAVEAWMLGKNDKQEA